MDSNGKKTVSMKHFAWGVSFLFFVSPVYADKNSVLLSCFALLQKAARPVAKALEGVEQAFVHAAQVFDDLQDLAVRITIGKISRRDPRVRKAVLWAGETLHRTGQLDPIIDLAVTAAYRLGKLPSKTTPEKVEYIKAGLKKLFHAELISRGAAPGYEKNKYVPWLQLSKKMVRDSATALEPLRKKYGNATLLDKPEFAKVFEDITGTKLHGGSEVKLLVDGPASFAERDRLIREAKDTLYLSTWGWYDDPTGEKYAKLLIQKKQKDPHVEIKVMADKFTASDPGMSHWLDEMSKNGIEVIKWLETDTLHPENIYHRKLLITDGQNVIMGGMNMGSHYSHIGAEVDKNKWRDTDILVRGSVAADVHNDFTKDWNAQRRRPDGDNEELSPARRPAQTLSLADNARSGITVSNPGRDQKILEASILAMEAATQSIDVENAYFLLNPAVYETLLRAKKRGVRVRIFTNSSESVDVPEMSYVMMKAAHRLASKGFEVYLKQGSTLHSKFMTVDGIYTWVGSHNFNARSVRNDHEIIFSRIDPEFAAEVEKTFERDIKGAPRLDPSKPLPYNYFGEAASYWFYDQI